MRAAIVYISGSEKQDIMDLKKSLRYLHKNFNNRFQYPVIIFHEDFSEDLLKDIQSAVKPRLRFKKIHLKTPDHIDEEKIKEIIKDKSWYLGYLNMIRWCSKDFFLHQVMENFDWYWHFDTDSFLVRKVNYDVFAYMEKNNFNYGYQTIMIEKPYACENFWETTKEYIKSRKIKPTFLDKYLNKGEWDRSYYYADFEISKLDFWRSDKYMNYFDYMDKSGGIYKYRWGDTLFHSMAVFMYMDESETHQFTDIGWKHQRYINDPSKLTIHYWRRKLGQWKRKFLKAD